jgi:hypothetical protein
LRKLQTEFRGTLQMIESDVPILRNARSHGGADRQIMRAFRLGFPRSLLEAEWEKGAFAHRRTRIDHFSFATMPVFPMRKNPREPGAETPPERHLKMCGRIASEILNDRDHLRVAAYARCAQN